MKHKKCLAALTAAGIISAMALGMAVTSYAADGWTRQMTTGPILIRERPTQAGFRPARAITIWIFPTAI